jgi:hypothetical protein
MRSQKSSASHGGEEKLETRSHCLFSDILYINSLRLSISQSVTGVLGGGGGRGRWSSGRSVSVCDGGWTTTVSMYKPSPQNIAAIRRVGMTVRSHPSPTAPETDIKTFFSPPTTEKIDNYIEERVFRNFQNFWEPRFKMSKPGFWVFSRQVRE